MDPLLRAAIRRRDKEADLLSRMGDCAALIHCDGCGIALRDDPRGLRCTACGRLRYTARRDAMERFIDRRRQQLQAIGHQVTSMGGGA